MSPHPLFVTPVEVFTGVLVALLFGVPVAALVGSVGFLAPQAFGRPVPPIAGGTVTVAITAGVAFGTGVLTPIQPGLVLGLGLVALLGLYATSQGTQRAEELPRATVGSIERCQPLAGDAIDAVDAVGQVTIRSTGTVREPEGYPPLDPDRRQQLAEGAWRLPADLPLSALENRLAARLRTTHDLETVSVSIDGRGRATIAAAPRSNPTDVPDGWRAVSVRALLPAGLTAGDDVTIVTESTTVSGTVRAVTVDSSTDRGSGADPAGVIEAIGGEGRVTVAVPTTDVAPLLAVDRARIVVRSQGTTQAFDAISVLERGGAIVRQVTLTDTLIGRIADDDTDFDAVAVRETAANDDEDGWRFDPDQDGLAAGMEAFVAGTDVPSADAPEPDRNREPIEVVPP